MVIKGVNGQIELLDDKVVIHRKGILARLNGLRGSKTIFISSITGIQLKEPGFTTNGFIEFMFSGGKENSGGLLKATQNENVVMFSKDKLKDFQKLKDEIEKRMNNIHNSSTSVKSDSYIEELEGLAKLKEQGILTEEEFQMKKKEILGI